MRVVLIYGPPASGKLTVAKQLSKITGYKIFHNHLTVDMVESVINKENNKFWGYVNKFRYDMIKILSKEKINLILTLVYDADHPNNIKNIEKIVKRHNGKINFVQLAPSKEVLLKRVKGKSRERYNKVKSPRELSKGLKEYNIRSSANVNNNFKIDNSNMSAKRTAEEIKNHFKLK